MAQHIVSILHLNEMTVILTTLGWQLRGSARILSSMEPGILINDEQKHRKRTQERFKMTG